MGFKFHINPAHESGRDTLCQALRQIHRRFEAAGDIEGMHLAAKSFDFAKRIVAAAKMHKEARGITGPLIQDGHPDKDD